MKPIPTPGATDGKPFTVTNNGTIESLYAMLGVLISLGHGKTHVVRADSHAGPCSVRRAEYYDTAAEMERGELNSSTVFLLC